jgi:hypothetical protein
VTVKVKIAELEAEMKQLKEQLKSGRDLRGRPLSSKLEESLNSRIVELQKKENLLLAQQQRIGRAVFDSKSSGQSDARQSSNVRA